MSIFRRMSLAGIAFLLAATTAQAGILVSAKDGETRAPDALIADAVGCVAAVLAYQTRDAQTFCGRVIAASPNDPLGYKYRGFSYLLEHRFDRAEQDFGDARRLAPNDAENQAGYAQALSGQGRYAAAIPHFDAALKLVPDDVRYLAARCWALGGEGRDLDKALADCNRAAGLAPDYVAVRLNRGMVRLKQHNWRAAIQDYTRAIDNDGDVPSGLFGRGVAWLQLKEDAQGRADIQAARQADPTIDALFIRVGVLPASCHQAGGDCPLPPDLRYPGSVLMVSYRPERQQGDRDMDGYVRGIALERMDAMLERTAELLGTKPQGTFSPPWEDSTPLGAVRHVMRLQLEYARQQDLACASSVLSGKLCQKALFNPSPALAEDPTSLRWEVDHTMNAIHPFWMAVCRAKRGGCFLE